MMARGIDPGETIGWCDLERESPGVFRFLECGTWEATRIRRGDQMPAGWIAVVNLDVIAIETAEEMHPNEVRALAAYPATAVQTIRNLLETRALAERIACSLIGAGARVVEPTAAECRRALGVKFGAQRGRGPKLTVDQQIAHIIPLAVRGWPKRSNPHVRDAAAAAMWALGSASLAIGTEIDVITMLSRRNAPCPREDCPFARCTDTAHWMGA
jgi:hypothetical protein